MQVGSWLTGIRFQFVYADDRPVSSGASKHGLDKGTGKKGKHGRCKRSQPGNGFRKRQLCESRDRGAAYSGISVILQPKGHCDCGICGHHAFAHTTCYLVDVHCIHTSRPFRTAVIHDRDGGKHCPGLALRSKPAGMDEYRGLVSGIPRCPNTLLAAGYRIVGGKGKNGKDRGDAGRTSSEPPMVTKNPID